MNKIPVSSLYVSEPNPRMFGNGPNPTTAEELSKAKWTQPNWLRSRFHFAFAEWRSRISRFGVLRVLNDDTVMPHRAFADHPHHNMEIATFVLDGKLTHADSLGNRESLGRGSVQFMSAGEGVVHSEGNFSDEPLRFLQLWVLPQTSWGASRYGSYSGETKQAIQARHNQWSHLVSGDRDVGRKTPIKLNQDVNIYLAENTFPAPSCIL